MSPKKVCGVILIVLGVLSVINASGALFVVDFFGNEIHAMNATMEKYGYKDTLNLLDTSNSEKIISKSKTITVMSLLAGVLMGFIGLLMLRNPMPRPTYDFDDDDEEEPLEERRFRL